MLRIAMLLAFLGLASCGGASAAREDEVIGATNADPPALPIDVELRMADGTALALSQLRGKVVLVYLFATFDGVSQAALRPLTTFVREHPNVHVLGIAIQPDARALLDAWVAALEPPFTVAYEREEQIAQGVSAFGPIEAVPTFIVLDASGRIRETHVGYASERTLERMLAAAARP